MQAFAELCEAIARTTKKKQKVQLVAAFIATQPVEQAAQAAIFLSGRAFAAYRETTTNVGGTLLWRAVLEIARVSNETLTAAYRQHGDLGSAGFDVLLSRAPAESSISLPEFAARLEAIALARGPAAKQALVVEALRRCTALEAKY